MAETFSPDWASPPGDTLRETLDSLGMTQKELAERAGVARKTINGIVNGEAAVSLDTAMRFEKVFRVPARFWVGLQAQYDEALAREAERSRLAAHGGWIREAGFPYAELAKRGVVPESRDPVDRVAALLRFFGVATPEALERSLRDCERACSFRRSTKLAGRSEAIAAWLRLGELETEGVPCARFSPDRLRSALPSLRALASLPLDEAMERLVEECRRLGVALAIVPGLRGAPIHGATRWTSGGRPLVQMSLRGKDDGNAWFTFFHEIGHLLLHDRRKVFLELDEEASTAAEEAEADAFARDLLVPPRDYEAFLDRHPGLAKSGAQARNKAIKDFARSIRMPPGVVVGRLQNDRILPYRHANELKARCGD